MNRVWIFIGIGLLAVIVLAGLSGRGAAPEVTAASASRQNLEHWISSNGKIEPNVPHTLRAQLATFVESVHAVEGSAVRRGQLLAVLDAAAARAELARWRGLLLTAQEDLRAARAGGAAVELAQLESDLRKAQAEAARLRSERQAIERLLASRAATQHELEENQLALERAEANLHFYQQKKQDFERRAETNLQRAQQDVERATNEIRALEDKVGGARVVSPVDGTLYLLPVRQGQYVAVGDVVAEVADLRSVRLRAFVDEPELGWLAEGQHVAVTWDAMPGRSWAGRTEHLPKTVVARGARSVGEVLCSIDNEKLELLPNINVNVRIRVRESSAALVVPRAAVRGEGADRYVYRLESSRIRRQPVRVGVASATQYEILEGLKEGDRVVVLADVELADGAEVRVVDKQ